MRTAAEVLIINSNLMKPPVTPVAVDFLASVLRAEGFGVRFLDLAFEQDIDAALEREIRTRPLFVGVTVRNVDDSFFATRDFCLGRLRPIIRKIKRLTDAPVVLGGVGYSIFPVAALEFCDGDYGIHGDGEIATARLAKALAADESPSNIPGLIFRANGEYGRNKPAPVDLSKLDLSDRATVDNPRYLREGGMVGFETKRGCASACAYCAEIPAKGNKSRLRPPEQVAREIAGLVGRGIDHFQTCDSEFNIPYNHAVDVCRELIRAGLGEKIRWYTYMTPYRFDERLAYLMRQAGCAGINFGADHSNPSMLRTLGRNHTARMIAEASRLCRRHDIVGMFDLLLGAPGETRKTLREAVEFIKSIDPSCVGVSLGVRIYPGTELARILTPQLRLNSQGVCGAGPDNPGLLRPAYFMSPELGEDPYGLLAKIVGKDDRFLLASPDGGDGDFNYNDNSTLSEAIRAGARGTFWDILRRHKTKKAYV